MNNFYNRKYIVQIIFLIVGVILLCKLFYIQVIDDKYFLSANSNVLRKLYIFPARGVITDRNNKVLAQNTPISDLMVIPNQIEGMDTLEFCKTMGISRNEFNKRIKKAKVQSNFQASAFEKQLNIQVYENLKEKLYKFPGFYFQSRTIRNYPDSVAAQFLGYTKEVSPNEIKASNGFYRPGDYIGKSGVERSYEDVLRGQRGVVNLMFDAHNTSKGSYADGAYDTVAKSGDELISTLDLPVQKLGEQLMRNKVGSVVAIEPNTGEILAYISSPTYDPNFMVGKEFGNHYMELIGNPYRPFTNRPIQGYYPPGSSFKPVDALIALQDGVITPETIFFCPHGYRAGNHVVKCEHFDGPTNLRKGIAKSCNTYFCYVFQHLLTQKKYKSQKEAYTAWREKIMRFGFGDTLGVDLPYEKKGILPERSYFDRLFRNSWRYQTVISLAIGQGEISATPLQMANTMAIIANRGYYFKPHLIKALGEDKSVLPKYTEKHFAGVDAKHYEPVIEGMFDVVNGPGGTARSSMISNIVLCGKTGTVQNPHGKNHSVFVGFAPKDNPKIAIAVIVENGGYGSSFAAPIASLMVEKYINKSLSGQSNARVNYMKNANLLPALKAKTESKNIVPKTKLSTTILNKSSVMDSAKYQVFYSGQQVSEYFLKMN